MFKLGADPEIFLQDAAHAYVSAIGKIGGTKEQPKPLPIGDGFAVQEDNVAIEYNIPASDSKHAFTNNINKAMSFLSDTVAHMGLQFANTSAVSYPMTELMDERALVFGCDPDYNAWRKGKRNPRPKASDPTLRTCGGHVHIGGIDTNPFMSEEDVINFIKHMDLYLGVPSILMDSGELRKQLYGKAGAFRYKPYGCEYRSLSNFWVFDSKLTNWVWDSTALAMNAWKSNAFDIDSDKDLILESINNNNKLMAERLVDKYKLLVV
jgi:Phage phiEco32-like COOH.NH2 ligase-type 2